jgi:hypothetical protein
MKGQDGATRRENLRDRGSFRGRGSLLVNRPCPGVKPAPDGSDAVAPLSQPVLFAQVSAATDRLAAVRR